MKTNEKLKQLFYKAYTHFNKFEKESKKYLEEIPSRNEWPNKNHEQDIVDAIGRISAAFDFIAERDKAFLPRIKVK